MKKVLFIILVATICSCQDYLNYGEVSVSSMSYRVADLYEKLVALDDMYRLSDTVYCGDEACNLFIAIGEFEDSYLMHDTVACKAWYKEIEVLKPIVFKQINNYISDYGKYND